MWMCCHSIFFSSLFHLIFTYSFWVLEIDLLTTISFWRQWKNIQTRWWQRLVQRLWETTDHNPKYLLIGIYGEFRKLPFAYVIHRIWMCRRMLNTQLCEIDGDGEFELFQLFLLLIEFNLLEASRSSRNRVCNGFEMGEMINKQPCIDHIREFGTYFILLYSIYIQPYWMHNGQMAIRQTHFFLFTSKLVASKYNRFWCSGIKPWHEKSIFEIEERNHCPKTVNLYYLCMCICIVYSHKHIAAISVSAR